LEAYPAMSEQDVQRSVIDYIVAVAPGIFIYAIPNSGRRERGCKASNAVSGLRKGAPDLGLVLPGGRAAFIECKSEKGRLSWEQEACAEAIEASGGLWVMARGINDVRHALADWGVTTRDADALCKKTGARV